MPLGACWVGKREGRTLKFSRELTVLVGVHVKGPFSLVFINRGYWGKKMGGGFIPARVHVL